MSVKRFIGLGEIKNPFSIGGNVTTAPAQNVAVPGGQKGTIVVNHYIRQNQNQGAPNATKVVKSTPLSPWQTTNPGKQQKSSLNFTPDTIPLVYSQESGIGTADTLFYNFNLDVIPFYNFWVEDELTNDTQELGQRKLEDIPRFIKIVWNKAPELPGRDFEVIRKSDGNLSNPTVNGLKFNPSHLNPQNFSLVKKSTVNGYIAPAMVQALVESTSGDIATNTLYSLQTPADNIDEDQFLSNPDNVGLNINELKLNMLNVYNNVATPARINTDNLTPGNRELKNAIFDGNVSVQRPAIQNDSLVISNNSPNSPSLSISVKTSHTSKLSDSNLFSVAQKSFEPLLDTNSNKTQFLNATFVYPVLSGLLNTNSVLKMKKPEHAESMVSMAPIMSQLSILYNSGINDKDIQTAIAKIPSFAAPEGLKPLEYIGYVIEKYQQKDGSYELVEEFDISDPTVNYYYDTKILYGEVYRYRIRSILRWTRQVKTISNSQTKPIASYRSSYIDGQFSSFIYGSALDTTPPNPPDEVTVIPQSNKKRIMVTLKLPDNSQRDIINIRLYRKLKNQLGIDLTGWTAIANDFPAGNVLFFDKDVDFFENNKIQYVYTAICLSRHNEFSPLSTQISAKLCKNWEILGEYPVIQVSDQGVDIKNFGSFATNPPTLYKVEQIVDMNKEDETSDKNNSKFYFKGREKFGNQPMDDNFYLIRAESMDTGEHIDTFLNLTYNNQKPLNREVKEPGLLNGRSLFDSNLPFFGKLL